MEFVAKYEVSRGQKKVINSSLEAATDKRSVRYIRSNGRRDVRITNSFTLIILAPQRSRGRVAVVTLSGHRNS